jgi:hypothetical protein
MLSKRRVWLERVANWGTALAVPLVAFAGFELLMHARDAAQPVAGRAGAGPRAAPGRVLAPPIDASAPPVVELGPSRAATEGQATVAAPAPGEDPRCAALEREIGRLDEAVSHAAGGDAERRLHGRVQGSRDEARTRRCLTRARAPAVEVAAPVPTSDNLSVRPQSGPHP